MGRFRGVYETGVNLIPSWPARDKLGSDKRESKSETKLSADKRESNRRADKPEPNRSADKPDRSPSSSQSSRSCYSVPESRSSSQSRRSSAKPKESFPLADALFRAVGQHLDADETERHLFGEFAEHLWRGNFVRDTSEGPVPQAYASKARLERMLSKASEIRQEYQQRLFDVNAIEDRDFKLSLIHI